MEWGDGYCRGGTLPPTVRICTVPERRSLKKNQSYRPGFEIFILLLVGASSISLVSAESGENSLIPLRLLFPPNPLRWASAGTLFLSSAESEEPPKICSKTA